MSERFNKNRLQKGLILIRRLRPKRLEINDAVSSSSSSLSAVPCISRIFLSNFAVGRYVCRQLLCKNISRVKTKNV